MKRHVCQWFQQSALAVEGRSWLRRLAMTAVSIAFVALVVMSLPPPRGTGIYLLFHPAIIWTTWYGGFRMGALGTLLSLVAIRLFLMPAHDGHWLSLHWSALIFAPISLLLAWLTDLLRRTMMELELAWNKTLKDKEAMDQLYESISDAFFSLDHEWRFVFVNRKALELKPPEERDLVGRNLWESCGHKITNDGKERLRAAMRDRRPTSFEHHLPGTEVWQEVHVYPSERGLSLFLTDISERKKLEERLEAAHEQLRRYAVELEGRVNDRGERLREMAAELETFSYSVSHDLRSPLRSMQACAQTLLDQSGRELEPTARSSLERIERAARRLDQLIQDVLTFEQLAGARFTVEKVDLNELIRDIISQYPRLARNQHHIQITTPLLSVKGNAACLTQCLANLIDNSLKFVSPQKPPLVRVSTTRVGNNVSLAIEDARKMSIARDETGDSAGLLEADGIGLAIAKKSAERMGGQVTVQSEQGKNKRFIVQLEAA